MVVFFDDEVCVDGVAGEEATNDDGCDMVMLAEVSVERLGYSRSGMRGGEGGVCAGLL